MIPFVSGIACWHFTLSFCDISRVPNPHPHPHADVCCILCVIPCPSIFCIISVHVLCRGWGLFCFRVYFAPWWPWPLAYIYACGLLNNTYIGGCLSSNLSRFTGTVQLYIWKKPSRLYLIPRLHHLPKPSVDWRNSTSKSYLPRWLTPANCIWSRQTYHCTIKCRYTYYPHSMRLAGDAYGRIREYFVLWGIVVLWNTTTNTFPRMCTRYLGILTCRDGLFNNVWSMFLGTWSSNAC